MSSTLKKTIKKQRKKDKNYDNLSSRVSKHQKAQTDAGTYGKRLGRNLAKKFNDLTTYEDHKGETKIVGFGTDIASTALAEMLFKIQEVEEKDCFNLLMQWTQEKLWAKMVVKEMPKMNEIWEFLYSNGYTSKDKGHTYGDIDGTIWAECVDIGGKYDKLKIIIHISHCTCADANTHIYIMSERLSYEDREFGDMKLHIRKVWPREKKETWNKKYVAKPSLNTYKKNYYKLEYGDGRDKGYVLSIDDFGVVPKVDWAHIHEPEIQHALWLIGLMYGEIKKLEENLKKESNKNEK